MTIDRDRLTRGAPASATDEAFRRLAAGDLEALEELYDLEADGLFALALWVTGSRDAAADAVQQAFVRLASRRWALDRVKRPRAYLMAMARSAAVDGVRSSGALSRIEQPAEELLLEASTGDRWFRSAWPPAPRSGIKGTAVGSPESGRSPGRR